MNIDLTDTTSAKINSSLIEARKANGSPAVGMVLTLVIVTDEGNHYDALKAAQEASREHPSRVLVVIRRPGRSPREKGLHRLDAEVRVGGDSGSGTGETIILRLHGELAAHAESVVLPLLLPDAPVVTWWPADAPKRPADSKLGRLALHRVTDAWTTADPLAHLDVLAENYEPGDTDLSWTRLTNWRSMLAAALDQTDAKPVGATVEAEEHHPSAELLALWLGNRLNVPVKRVITDGPQITAARLHTADGDVVLSRPDGTLAHLDVPGQPTRPVALKQRELVELVAEELRRLDPDVVYEETLRYRQKLRADGECPPWARAGDAADGEAAAERPAPKKAASRRRG